MEKLPSLFTIQNELQYLEEEMLLAIEEGREISPDLEEKMSELLFMEGNKIASCCAFFDNVEKEIEFAKEQKKIIDSYIEGLVKKQEYLVNLSR